MSLVERCWSGQCRTALLRFNAPRLRSSVGYATVMKPPRTAFSCLAVVSLCRDADRHSCGGDEGDDENDEPSASHVCSLFEVRRMPLTRGCPCAGTCTRRLAAGPWCRSVSYTHLRAHETRHDLVCRL